MVVMDAPRLRPGDLQILTGQPWIGTLTYLDYGTNKRVSIASNLSVSHSRTDTLVWVFAYEYPDEPKANSQDTLALSRDGRTIHGERVVERAGRSTDTLKIVTEKRGTDNDKQAVFRLTYLISAKSFAIRKEVRYEGADGYIERNRYDWKR
jgi:hypothetical protein